jgi:hypothetical protein
MDLDVYDISQAEITRHGSARWIAFSPVQRVGWISINDD